GPRAGQTRWWPSNRCRSFASRPPPTRPSTAVHPERRFPSSLDPARTNFTARYSISSATTHWTPRTGSPTPTVFPSQNCGRTISAACLVALCCCLVFTMAVIIPSSFSPTKVCDYASRRLSLPTCLRFPRGTDAPTSLQPYLNSFPLPNRPDTRYGFAPFVASFADSASLDAASLRIDHSIGNRLTL